MGEKVKSPLLDKYIKEGKKIYSFSKLGSMHNCEYEYYNTYVAKKKGRENVYSLIGNNLHEQIEGIYRSESDKEKMIDGFYSQLTELEILGVNFPNEKIKDSYVADVGHFVKNFKPIDTKFVLEKHIVFPINDEIIMQGYVDAIQPSNKGKPYVNIIDWKTSSKFSGKKLDEAGRQLLMYKLGIESTTNLKVDKIMWFMIKYLYVCWKLKNGNIKKKMCNRGKWVKEMSKTFEKDMLNLGMDELEVGMIMDQATRINSIEDLPNEIKEKYTIEDCFVEYEATPEKEEELKQYVIDTVHTIESKSNDESDWKGLELNKYNSFYCSTLCGHRSHCKYYKAFMDENADDFKKKENKDDFSMENLFG